MKILVINGHPDEKSFCAALVESYAAAATTSGHEVKVLNIGALSFDPVLRHGYRVIQELEPDLTAAQELVKWADHLVWIYPMWWYGMPSLLKGFIDRAWLPGFAFKYQGRNPLPKKLLKGKTARIITTGNAPGIFYWLTGNPAQESLARTLGFSGVSPVRTSHFGSLRGASDRSRAKWIGRASALGWRGR